jgi:hypothetical protein
MALTTCRECQAQVSTEAMICPHCGAPGPGQQVFLRRGFEWKSSRTVLGYPLVHIALGRDSRGKRLVAKGVIAIGQFAIGLITVAQFGVGLLFGFGQFIFGCTVVAQFAGGLLLGIGQFATGYAAIGQFVLAYYGLAQLGLAKFMWGAGKFGRKDPAAVNFFLSWWEAAKHLLTK